ncbi:MAG: hypothetical protein U1A27_04770 [Phycisphaerae bacterium]
MTVRARWVMTATLVLASRGPLVRADAVQDANTLHANVTILGIQDDGLVFVFNDGRTEQRPCSTIKRILLTAGNDAAAADLSAGERARIGGDRPQAVEHYEHVLSKAQREWVRDYATLRLIRLYDDVGQTRKAYRAYTALAVNRPGLLADALPRRIPRADSQVCREILVDIDARLERSPSAELTAALTRYRNAILRLPDTPPAAQPAPGAPGTPPDAAPGPAGHNRPPSQFGLAFQQAREMISAGDLAGADRVISSLRSQSPVPRPELLLVDAERALAAGDLHGAAIAAMRLLVDFPESPLAADALFVAAQTQEKLGRAYKALELYRRCAALAGISEQRHQAAQGRIAALTASESAARGGPSSAPARPSPSRGESESPGGRP